MKEYVSAKRPAKGPATITVSLVDETLSSRYSVAAYGGIKAAVRTARKEAHRQLAELREAWEEAVMTEEAA